MIKEEGKFKWLEEGEGTPIILLHGLMGGVENFGDMVFHISKKHKVYGLDLKLFEGSDKFLRDFVCVDDIVDIVLHNDKSSGIYDLGTSNPVSFQHVAECVAKKYNGEIEYIPFPDHLKGKYQEYTRACREWGYHPFITVEEYLS